MERRSHLPALSQPALIADTFPRFTPLIEFMRIAFPSVAAAVVASSFALPFLMGSRVVAAEAAAESVVHARMGVRHRALLQTHCLKCHGPEMQEGKFRVDDLPYEISNIETAERWQKILNALNSGEMPPSDEPQPANQAKADFLEELAGVMVAARKGLGDQKGVITMRRLNRREYRNTLRELLGTEINVSELPADTGTGGFDTVGANLFMSANQFEQYQALGREALEEAFAWQAAAGVEKKLHYEAEKTTPIVAKFVAYQIDARERAKQWVKAVEEAAAKPENAEIVAKLKKESKSDAIFRRSWDKIPGAPNPRSFGFDKKGENDADLANDSLGAGWLPYHQYYMSRPDVDRGAYLGTQTRHPAELNVQYIELLVPFDWPVGEYVVRVRTAATPDAPPERRFLEFGIHPRTGRVLSTHEVTGTPEAPQTIEIPLTLTRGHAVRENRSLFFREKGSWDNNVEGGRKRSEAVKRNGVGPEVALWVDWIEVERKPGNDKPKPPGIAALGIPLDDKSPAPSPSELRAALERFSVEAFRGSVPPASYVDRLVALYDLRRKAGDKHSAALKQSLSVVLASPMFLYLAEPTLDERRRSLSGQELAVRLAYFLWGAPPDAKLRGLAERGELAKPEVLAAETERLLDDPRADGFLKPFAYQWLGLDRLDFFEINLALHPKFDMSTQLAAKAEVYETVEHLLRNNLSLRDLLKADYVLVNRVLADYYGLAGVKGDHFRKVQLPAGSPRGGLLGMAAVHVMGGNGEHSSPVERGAWVLRKLLNDPPPPAPANVPLITRLAGKSLTTRERLVAHQEEAQCASCHRKIDPIGLGLENFDAVGLWRTEDSYEVKDANGRPVPKTKRTWQIDSAGAFHNGPAFKDYFELRELIGAKSDSFARGFSMALIEYALGRPCGFSDEALVDDMLRQAGKKDFAIREFVHALVRSKEFQTK